jgi:hypothetical protein
MCTKNEAKTPVSDVEICYITMENHHAEKWVNQVHFTMAMAVRKV